MDGWKITQEKITEFYDLAPSLPQTNKQKLEPYKDAFCDDEEFLGNIHFIYYYKINFELSKNND